MSRSDGFLLLTLAGAALLAALQGCSRESNPPEEVTATPAPVTVASITPPPTLEEAANATYTGVYVDKVVTLKDGRWEGEPFVLDGASRPKVGLIDDFQLNGDLNGDGSDETVVFLWESSGGSGTFTYVAAVGWRDDRLVNLGSALVGNRVQLQAGRVSDGKIELDVVQQGSGDAACCPGQTATRVWSPGAEGLEEGPVLATGALSLTDLAGVEWVLTELEWNEPAPPRPEVTLVFDGERITGKSACNRYFAGVQAGDMPGDLVISEIGGTRMACPDEVMSMENHYLEALGNTTRHSFLFGKLALTWQQNKAVHTMRFAPRIPQE